MASTTVLALHCVMTGGTRDVQRICPSDIIFISPDHLPSSLAHCPAITPLSAAIREYQTTATPEIAARGMFVFSTRRLQTLPHPVKLRGFPGGLCPPLSSKLPCSFSSSLLQQATNLLVIVGLPLFCQDVANEHLAFVENDLLRNSTSYADCVPRQANRVLWSGILTLCQRITASFGVIDMIQRADLSRWVLGVFLQGLY